MLEYCDRAMTGERPHRRRELMVPYEQPYRHVLGTTWRHQRDLRLATTLAGLLWLAGATGVALGVEELGIGAGLGAFLGSIAILLWLAAIARTSWRMTRSWDRSSELGEVRACRPQAGSEDLELAHDEFAVTVEDDGHLVTWRFRPLSISEHPAEDETEIPGRPRYAASPVGETTFDPLDTAQAAEQLVAAQTRAAERESASAAAAHATLAADSDLAALVAETRATAAALREATGQRSGRR
ncbi:hypothetical protein OM076_21915 [Solirubrobacter ginsenosidimutans]|uniref:Uncharacterized protein n=1 Tax=Solirubrobacter ginsenosidimutans TaxID=490573 RepID=A0A9X3S1Z0_9ACTN|nr:hypothetical protein [Solirubrobacter ginsenosidimutans]MDA0162944.1 hypothetical protein [Solirubrobacter ginsenosidimutans]